MGSERDAAPAPAPGSGARAAAREALGTLAWIGAAAAVIALAYLSLYIVRRYAYPVGYDTPRYLYRTNLAAAQGVGPFGLDTSTDATRVGNPVLSALTAATLGVPALHLAFVWPAVVAVVTGLAAGVFAVSGLEEPRWSFPLYAVAVGVSVNVASVAGSLLDNLFVSPLLMAGAATALLAAEGEAWLAGPVLLVAGAAIMEWYFAALLVGILALVAVAFLPGSVRSHRAGTPLVRTPSGRLGVLAAGSAVGGAVALVLAPGSPSGVPREGNLFESQLRALVPRFRFWITGPVMAAGIVALAGGGPRTSRRRRGLLFAVVWAGTGAVAVAATIVFRHVPANRVLDAALVMPILGTAALLGLVRVLRARAGPVGLAVGAVVAVVAVASWGLAGRGLWLTNRPLMGATAYAQAAAAGRYLQEVEPTAPAVIVVSSTAASEGKTLVVASRTIRSALPGAVVPRVYLAFGDPEAVAAGAVPTPGGTRFDTPLSGVFGDTNVLPGPAPAIIALAAYDPALDAFRAAHPDRVVAPGVVVVPGGLVLPGSPGSSISAVPPPAPPSALRLVAWTAGVLGLLWLVGLGWSVGLTGGAGSIAALGLAPAFGMAALALVGLAGSLVSVALSGGQGAVLVASAAAVGWVPTAARRIAWRLRR